MVPEEADPPTTPSTDHVGLPLLAVNCCVMVNVSSVTRGVTANPVPVPDKLMDCGLPGALSVMATDEMREPVVVGVKVTLIVQELFGNRVAPQLFVCPKSPASPPEIKIELMLRFAPPTFVILTGCGLLVTPVCWLPKLTLEGLRVTKGVEPPEGVRKATICMIQLDEMSDAVAL